MGTTLAEKVWADHLVRKGSDGAPDLLYIDLMLMACVLALIFDARSILLEGRMSTRSSTTSTTRPNRDRMLLSFMAGQSSFGGVRVRRRWARKKPTALAANTK